MGIINEIKKIGWEYLPSCELINVFEIGIPIYSLEITCFCNKTGTLPSIQDTILRLVDQGIRKEEIPLLMGLEEDLNIFTVAYNELIHQEFIQRRGMLSDLGREYLKEDKYTRNIKKINKIFIDGVSNTYFRSRENFVNSRNMRGKNIRDIKMVIERPNLKDLNFYEAKRIMNQNEEDELVVDLLEIKNSNVFYKRAQIAIFYDKKSEKNYYLIFDRLNMLTEYDEFLRSKDITEFLNLEEQIYDYEYSDKVKKYREVVFDKDNVSDEYDEFKQIIEKSKDIVRIYIPMIDSLLPTDSLIETFKHKLNNKIRIELFFTGEMISTNYGLLRIGEIEKLAKQYKGLKISHLPEYYPMSVSDGKIFFCIDFYEHIIINSNKDINTCCSVGSFLTIEEYNQLDLESVVLLDGLTSYTNKKHMEMDVKKIIDEFYLFDMEQRKNNRKAWLTSSEEINENQDSLERLPFVKNKNDYEIMLTNLNKFFFETLKNKYRANYFFNDFKNYYPKLQKIMLKIRIYRNAVQHIELSDPEDRQSLKDFLKEDTGGSYPGLVDNGYAKMQYLILNELLEALREERESLRKVE